MIKLEEKKAELQLFFQNPNGISRMSETDVLLFVINENKKQLRPLDPQKKLSVTKRNSFMTL